MWLGRTYCEALISTFYRFLARFSGRRRDFPGTVRTMLLTSSANSPLLITLTLVIINSFMPPVEGCSSRSTPKARPTPVTPSTSRPNVTFHTYPCPDNYDTFYCLNGATCFMVNIGESFLYNCECTEGYMGQRCELKDLEGSYVPSRHKVMLETASIASGATLAVFLVVIICILAYMYRHRKHKALSDISVVDSSLDVEKRVPFSKRDGHQIPLRQLQKVQVKGDVSGDIGGGDNLYAASLYNYHPPSIHHHHPP